MVSHSDDVSEKMLKTNTSKSKALIPEREGLLQCNISLNEEELGVVQV